jgi:hypothetical protein
LKRKDREYNVPDKIEILLDEKVGEGINELDSFDVIFGSNNNDDDDSSSEASTITTYNEHGSSSGTEGTEGTHLGDKGQECTADTVNNSQTSNDTTNHTNNNDNDNNDDKDTCQLNTEKSLDKGQCNSINQANNLCAYTPVASLASQSSHYLPSDQTLAIGKETAATTTTSSIVDISQNIYGLGHSDRWACKYCKLKGDRWFMGQHTCKGQPST